MPLMGLFVNHCVHILRHWTYLCKHHLRLAVHHGVANAVADLLVSAWVVCIDALMMEWDRQSGTLETKI